MDSNGPLTKRKWRSLQDTLDIKYDELDKEVDSILRAANGVLRECSHLATFEKDESDGSHSLVNGDNDVIYYSSSESVSCILKKSYFLRFPYHKYDKY